MTILQFEWHPWQKDHDAVDETSACDKANKPAESEASTKRLRSVYEESTRGQVPTALQLAPILLAIADSSLSYRRYRKPQHP